jgi:hypothetical protein
VALPEWTRAKHVDESAHQGTPPDGGRETIDAGTVRWVSQLDIADASQGGHQLNVTLPVDRHDRQAIDLAPAKRALQLVLARRGRDPCCSHKGDEDLALPKHTVAARVLNERPREYLLLIDPRNNAPAPKLRT